MGWRKTVIVARNVIFAEKAQKEEIQVKLPIKYEEKEIEENQIIQIELTERGHGDIEINEQNDDLERKKVNESPDPVKKRTNKEIIMEKLLYYRFWRRKWSIICVNSRTRRKCTTKF